MVQIIGLIIAVYAVARLIQVPIEHSKSDKNIVFLTLIALAASGVIGLLTLGLLLSGAAMPKL